MSPAVWPRDETLDERLLVIDVATKRQEDAKVRDLPRFLGAGDLLVLNDAATLPASLAATTQAGEPLEVRLLAHQGGRKWTCVLFGAGDWRTRTEHRAPPPRVAEGDRLAIGRDLSARVVARTNARLVTIAFLADEEKLWPALYEHGRPVQYAHVAGDLELWHAQTRYASRPWAVELPSAGRPLTWDLLRALERRGVGLATLTHAAGLSSTGDPAVDAMLPLPERYDIPESTVVAIGQARRVIAVGTTVVRALEGCVARHGRLVAGEGVTDLRLSPAYRRRVVHGIFTGMHEPETSHFALLGAFAPRAVLEAAYAHAEQAGYVQHEFGDSSLILAA